MEKKVIEGELVLPSHFSFKRKQFHDKYPKGQSKVRHKNLKQMILQIQLDFDGNHPSHHQHQQPNYVTIASPPPIHPPKRICDITGYQAPYFDARTKLRYANAEVFKLIRSLPNEYVQRYLALRHAEVVMR
ncbi:hypothetical protein Droror1_Dr00027407 [Drosera rotundifolia]